MPLDSPIHNLRGIPQFNPAETCSKSFFPRVDAIARQKSIANGKVEIWFSDEARIGQKNKITRR